jgi:hypothetical protein
MHGCRDMILGSWLSCKSVSRLVSSTTVRFMGLLLTSYLHRQSTRGGTVLSGGEPDEVLFLTLKYVFPLLRD